jgi:hypothetical protein
MGTMVQVSTLYDILSLSLSLLVLILTFQCHFFGPLPNISLGILTAILGHNNDKDGQKLLQTSLELFGRVQRHISSEEEKLHQYRKHVMQHYQEEKEAVYCDDHYNKNSVSECKVFPRRSATPPKDIVMIDTAMKHWSQIQLSIWNNQACVLSELSPTLDYKILQLLVSMGLALTGNESSKLLGVKDIDRFSWTVQTLMENKNYASAA